MIDYFARAYVMTHTQPERDAFCVRLERYHKANNRFALIWFGVVLPVLIALIVIFVR